MYCTLNLTTTLHSIWGFTTDDAYISWVYARQLANGNGFHWHIALPTVEGYSNFLWIIVAFLIIKLKLPLVISMKYLSCLSLGGALIILFRLARLFVSPLLAILPVVLFSHYIGVVWWTVSGMESMFYCFLALLFIEQCCVALGYAKVEWSPYHGVTKQPSRRAWVIVNITLLLLCLTRFEALVWIIPAGLFIFCQFKNYEIKQYFIKSEVHSWALISILCFVLPYTSYFLWRLIYFGHWIPNSYLCKALAPGQIFAVDLDYLLILLPLLALSIPYFYSVKRDCRHWLLWLPSLLYLLLLWKANPVITHLLRLFLAPFALFSLLPILGCQFFLNQYKMHLQDTKLLTVAIVLIATYLFVPGAEPAYLKALLNQYEERTQIRLKVAEILNKQATKGAAVLFGDCGLVPFTVRDDVRFVDTDCLNNAVFTHAPFNNNYELYAEHVMSQIKPEWVVTSYLPLQEQGNVLFDVLRAKDFFADYCLITTLKSRWHYESAEADSGAKVDYVYNVYKRKT